MDAYRQLLVQKGIDRQLPFRGPQASVCMDKVLGENALDKYVPAGSTVQHQNAIIAGAPSKTKPGVVWAKKTNVYVEKELGDTSFAVTYLGGRDKKPHEVKDKVVKHKPKDHPESAFYVNKFTTRKYSTQETAWRSAALKDPKGAKVVPPLPNNDELLMWGENKGYDFVTTSMDYRNHKGHKKRGQGDVFAKRTTVVLGSDEVKKGSTVRTDFANHGKAYKKAPSAIVKGSSNVFMNWDTPARSEQHVSTTMDYGRGFKPEAGEKPRFEKFNGVPRYETQSRPRY